MEGEVDALKEKLAEVRAELEGEIRKLTEALRESEERFRRAMQATNDVVWEWNMETDEVFRSDAFVHLFGYPDAVAGTGSEWWKERVHPDDLPGVVERVRRVVEEEGGDAWKEEYRFRRADGTYAYVFDRGSVLRAADGRPVRMIGAMIDVTARRQAEEALREGEERFRSAFEQAAVGMAHVGLNGKFLRVNRKLCEISGYAAEELLGKTYLDILFPEDREAAVAQTKRILAGEIDSYTQEVRFVRKGGPPLWVNATVALLRSADGRPKYFIPVVEDISARRAMEEALNEAKGAAEEASRAKSEFLANMSHEIRTPMTVIMASMEHLAATCAEPEQRQLLDMAENSAERLLSLIDDILDLSRIEARKVDLHEEPFEVRSCIAKTLQLFALKAQEKGLRLSSSISPEVPETVLGDPDRLGQVLVNLVGNSVKFTERGEVSVMVETAGAGASLRFSVRDTGIGIPGNKKALLFESFSQVDSSRTRRFGGTGLGLAVSKGLVELMRGTIGVESEEGKGSTFSFVLPLRPARPPGADSVSAGVSPARFPLRPLRVLLVEDDPEVRRLVEKMLRQRQWQVVTADDGRQAVDAWEAGKFDMIFMDVRMPGMDGLEATRIIRRREGAEGRRTPIVALTAHARPQDREECLAAGMDDCLVKPVRMERLCAVAESLLGK